MDCYDSWTFVFVGDSRDESLSFIKHLGAFLCSLGDFWISIEAL